jgi:hypothetical protein
LGRKTDCLAAFFQGVALAWENFMAFGPEMFFYSLRNCGVGAKKVE